MTNDYLEKIGISKRVFDVFVKKKTQDFTGEPIYLVFRSLICTSDLSVEGTFVRK